jgi:hypothetical protein
MQQNTRSRVQLPGKRHIPIVQHMTRSRIQCSSGCTGASAGPSLDLKVTAAPAQATAGGSCSNSSSGKQHTMCQEPIKCISCCMLQPAAHRTHGWHCATTSKQTCILIDVTTAHRTPLVTGHAATQCRAYTYTHACLQTTCAHKQSTPLRAAVVQSGHGPLRKPQCITLHSSPTQHDTTPLAS